MCMVSGLKEAKGMCMVSGQKEDGIMCMSSRQNEAEAMCMGSGQKEDGGMCMSSGQNGAEAMCTVQALECRQEGAMAAAVKKGLEVAVTPGASRRLVSGRASLMPAQ